MSGLRYTLLGDGSSDRLLDHPIRWVLRKFDVAVEVGQWADLSRLASKPRTLAERARVALELYPGELLFVHRDAEKQTRDERVAEIRSAIEDIETCRVAVVPVRMTEAWFLHDEAAIRRASGNPSGTARLKLPSPDQVESIVDPKQTLQDALLAATELSGRRLEKKKRQFGAMRARTAALIADFEPLRNAPAFAAFIDDLTAALMSIGHMERQS